MEDEVRREIRRHALLNASEHGGRTSAKIVLSKVLGAVPGLRGRAGEVAAEVRPIVDEVNSLTAEKQRDELGGGFTRAAGAGRTGRGGQQLPELEGARAGGVVTRFPPEPNGYPHIGHAKAAIINSEYADMYGGRKILRMDDTNPEGERMEYYAAIKVGMEWLGIKYDVVKNTSDDMELMYRKGLQMVEAGGAYVCTCKRDEVSRNRREARECRCRALDAGKTADRWHRMFEGFRQGEATVRMRGDMGSPNTVMRDPVLFRIIDGRHPLVGDRYRVWPSYDFAVAVEDSADGVTHAFRSKEYELRNELYYAILDALGMRRPAVLEFSRLAFRGMPVSKRVIRQLIEEGKIPWYDDPRLPTLEAMRRRGIRAEAVRRFVLSLGLTKSDTLAPFDALEAFNRRAIDGGSIRLNMVRSPRRLEISGMPAGAVEIRNHPTSEMGSRTVEVGGAVYVEAGDAGGLHAGDTVRLIGLGNVRITRASGDLRGEYAGDLLDAGRPKIQWVPQATAHRIKLVIPGPLFDGEEYDEGSLEEAEAYTEPHYAELGDGDPIQFIRFGYCRKDSRGQAIYTHR